MTYTHLKADVESFTSLSGVLSNLFQRVTIPLGLGDVEWSDLFGEYLEETFPDLRVRGNQRTNLPRSIWDNSDMTWDMFLIAIDILKANNAFLTVEVKQANGKLISLDPYDLINRPNFDKKGQTVKKIKDVDLVYRHIGAYDQVMSYPTLMLRDYLVRSKLLWSDFERLIEDFLNELPEDQKTSTTRAKLRGNILKSNLSWRKLMSAMEILDATKVNFTLTVEMTEVRKASASLLWSFENN